ncbi:MAG: chemotaxis-specific protein-glutamate methyltransferase CheB [Bacillota bacterium]
MEKLKVLIADRNVIFRRFIAEAIEQTGFGTAKHITSSGAIAIEWLLQCSIDIVLMDVSILEIEGIQILKKIKEENKDVEIVITSTTDQQNAAVVFKALELGAMDFMLKPPSDNEYENLESVISYLKSIFVQIMVKKYAANGKEKESINSGEDKIIFDRDNTDKYSECISTGRKRVWKGADLVLIAASTGGPQALETVLEGLSADFNKPVLIVQHMPPDFTRILAQTLDKKSRMDVFEAFDKAPVKGGSAAIAPGGYHMAVESSPEGGMLIRLRNTDFVNGVKPSADVLFHEVAKTCKGAKILAVILTGMGNDGTSGIEEMKRKCDCYCITQSEKTCVVYGMPRNVFEAGLSDEVADIDEIAKRIMQVG